MHVPIAKRIIGDTGYIELKTESQLFYYFNQKTKETTWNRPQIVQNWLDEKYRLLNIKTDFDDDIDDESENSDEYVDLIDETMAKLSISQIPLTIPYYRLLKSCYNHDFLSSMDHELKEKVYEKARISLLMGKNSYETSFMKFCAQANIKCHPHQSFEEIRQEYFPDLEWTDKKINSLKRYLNMISCDYKEHLKLIETKFESFCESNVMNFLEHIKNIDRNPKNFAVYKEYFINKGTEKLNLMNLTRDLNELSDLFRMFLHDKIFEDQDLMCKRSDYVEYLNQISLSNIKKSVLRILTNEFAKIKTSNDNQSNVKVNGSFETQLFLSNNESKNNSEDPTIKNLIDCYTSDSSDQDS